jgi:hypothetical protein
MKALHLKGRDLRLQADHKGGDRLRRQVHRPACSAEIDPGDRRAALPIDVDGLDRLQADMHGAIDRRPGARQYPDDAKRLVVVPRKADVAGAMGDDDLVADLVAELVRDLGTEDGVVEIGRTAAPSAITSRRSRA